MAKRRSLSSDPLVRSLIRGGVRAGLGDIDIAARVTSAVPTATPGSISRITTQERGRQKAVASLMSRDFRLRSNLHAIVGCGKGERVRGRIVVQWTDPQTGHTRQYGETMELASRGRLSDILNEAIGFVLTSARGRGYQPPKITSGMREGPTSWRLEYLDCV